LKLQLPELKKRLDADLDKSVMSSGNLMHSFALLNESSRKSGPYTDPRYIPFYYYLGKYIYPTNFMEMGFRLGLCSGCFLKSCLTVEHFFGFQKRGDEYYSTRLGMRNLRRNYRGAAEVVIGDILESPFVNALGKKQWDLAFMNEEMEYDQHRNYLDTIWNSMALGGLLVADNINSHKPGGTAFVDFCKTKNREPVTIATRYGVGIVQK
jgi:hypothetical protein